MYVFAVNISPIYNRVQSSRTTEISKRFFSMTKYVRILSPVVANHCKSLQINPNFANRKEPARRRETKRNRLAPLSRINARFSYFTCRLIRAVPRANYIHTSFSHLTPPPPRPWKNNGTKSAVENPKRRSPIRSTFIETSFSRIHRNP